MTRQLDKHKRKSGKARDHAQASSLDPRLVALVKYLARRAAERDYEDIQKASLSQADRSGADTSGDAGADS
ncbi:hypothetical protein TH25_21245 [Thalassospira profundimaris]|uniref:Uncharacterized protein n=1 Tax=Thalassospira profundimaris TaxID=502049 RepID=A0A367WQC3_9PROT|nr:hypothetical protein [Thalassospira profundimaris]RCK43676.1 hypothetical protein TH25_21245 [Thalassospira profundimaris]